MVAPNGARRTKSDHPALPVTPAEIAREALACREEGAAALHLHVRDDDDAHSLDAGRYRRACEAVRESVGEDLVIQITTEAVDRFSAEEQMEAVRALRPEAASVALREVFPSGADAGPVVEFFGWMQEAGIWAQVILYDPADAARFAELAANRFFPDRRPSALFVLGRYTPGQRSRPEDLDPFLEAVQPVQDSIEWSVCAFGPREGACIARALALGGHARVGFENNLLRADGTRADGNAEQVCAAAEAVRASGRTLMDAAALRGAIAGWR